MQRPHTCRHAPFGCVTCAEWCGACILGGLGTSLSAAPRAPRAVRCADQPGGQDLSNRHAHGDAHATTCARARPSSHTRTRHAHRHTSTPCPPTKPAASQRRTTTGACANNAKTPQNLRGQGKRHATGNAARHQATSRWREMHEPHAIHCPQAAQRDIPLWRSGVRLCRLLLCGPGGFLGLFCSACRLLSRLPLCLCCSFCCSRLILPGKGGVLGGVNGGGATRWALARPHRHFLTKIWTPKHMTEHDQHNGGVILSLVGWGPTPFPAPPWPTFWMILPRGGWRTPPTPFQLRALNREGCCSRMCGASATVGSGSGTVGPVTASAQICT